MAALTQPAPLHAHLHQDMDLVATSIHKGLALNFSLVGACRWGCGVAVGCLH